MTDKEKQTMKRMMMLSREYEQEKTGNLHGFTVGSQRMFTESFVAWLVEKLTK